MGNVIKKGEVMLIVHRRLFSDDERRIFVGAVEAYDDGIARVNGYTWRPDPHGSGSWQRKDDPRTKLVAIASGTLIVYPIPVANAADVEIMSDGGVSLSVRDGQGFEMDLSERLGV